MISDDKFNKILEHKKRIHSEYCKGKVSAIDFAYRTFFYIKQERIKFVKKAHDINSIIFNYYYWTAKIERKVMVERELYEINPEIASYTKLQEIIFLFIKRRNQMVRRLLFEFKDQLTIEFINVVHKDVLEIKIKEFDFPLYCNQSALSRIKIQPNGYAASIIPYYLPFLFYDKKLNIEKR